MSADLPADYTEASSRLPVLLKVEQWMNFVLDTGDEPSPAELEVMLTRVGRNDGPALLFDLYYEGLLSSHAATRCAGPAWSVAEYPQDLIPEETWRALFELAGYTENGQSARRPSEAVRLYRGATSDLRTRWSWTDDQPTARLFAEHYRTRKPGQVWTALVEPWRLLCRQHGDGTRGESEYVIDTAELAIELVG